MWPMWHALTQQTGQAARRQHVLSSNTLPKRSPWGAGGVHSRCVGLWVMCEFTSSCPWLLRCTVGPRRPLRCVRTVCLSSILRSALQGPLKQHCWLPQPSGTLTIASKHDQRDRTADVHPSTDAGSHQRALVVSICDLTATSHSHVRLEPLCMVHLTLTCPSGVFLSTTAHRVEQPL